MKEMIFCSALWQATKVGFTILTLKRSGRVWNGIIWIHQQKKPKTLPSAKKIMDTVFWDAEGCILIEFLEPGKTINTAHYVQTLLKLRRALRDKRPGRKVILQHDNAWPHTARLTLEKIENMGGKFSLTLRTVLIWHPPITISLVLWRIRCEANITRQMRHSRQLCINVFGQLEQSSTAREYSYFQNSGKNVYREMGSM